jgi:hypothetical protein
MGPAKGLRLGGGQQLPQVVEGVHAYQRGPPVPGVDQRNHGNGELVDFQVVGRPVARQDNGFHGLHSRRILFLLAAKQGVCATPVVRIGKSELLWPTGGRAVRAKSTIKINNQKSKMINQKSKIKNDKSKMINRTSHIINRLAYSPGVTPIFFLKKVLNTVLEPKPLSNASPRRVRCWLAGSVRLVLKCSSR